MYPSDAGLHLAVRLPDSVDATELAKRAADTGIRLEPLNSCALDSAAVNGLGFGFGMIDAPRIDEGIRRLVQLLDR